MRDPSGPLTPKKRVRRRRLLVMSAVAVPLAIPTVIWVITAVLAERAIGRALAAAGDNGDIARATGLRIAPAGPGVANAVPILMEADAAAGLSAAEDKLSSNLIDNLMTPNQLPALRQLVASKGTVLRRMRAAREVGAVDWSVLHAEYFGSSRWAPPTATFEWRPPLLVLYDAAWLAHHDGDDAAAGELLRDMLFLSRAMGDHPLLNSHVWSGMIGDFAVQLVEEWPDLRVGDGKGAASPAQVRALIADLIDEAHLRRAYQNHMRWERAYWLEHTRELGRANPLYHPLIRRDGARVIEIYSGILDAMDEPDLPAARAKLPEYQRPRSAAPVASIRYRVDTPEELARPLSVSFNSMYSVPGQPRQVQADHLFYRIANRRMAAIAVAIALYRAEHGGRLPPALDSLVPGYLARVPTDPFTPDGRPVRYLPHAVPPAVYCVGDNGRDDAAAAGKQPRYVAFFNRFFEPDQALHLGRPGGAPAMFPPATSPTARPTAGTASPERVTIDADDADEPGNGKDGDGDEQPGDRE